VTLPLVLLLENRFAQVLFLLCAEVSPDALSLLMLELHQHASAWFRAITRKCAHLGTIHRKARSCANRGHAVVAAPPEACRRNLR